MELLKTAPMVHKCICIFVINHSRVTESHDADLHVSWMLQAGHVKVTPLLLHTVALPLQAFTVTGSWAVSNQIWWFSSTTACSINLFTYLNVYRLIFII